MSSADELRARVAAAIADGEPIDWAAIEREGALPAAQLEAFRLLERMRASSSGGRGASDDGEPAAALETGFELHEEIGRGTTSRVWRARDKALGREVALKVLRESSALPEHARARFVQEARVLAALHHPNIVGIHAIGERGGRLHLSLELIRGATLETWVRERGRLSPNEAARIGVDLCRALAALHARGIVHRDVKPGNVMREEGGRIVLLDFSLARSADMASRWSSGSFAGTPMFMAPEQFEGRDVIGPAADVYGLGALLYWLVAARPACEGDTFAAVKQRVLAGRVTPLLDVRPDVPREFVRIVERALRADPRERYGSVGELERELGGFADAGAPRTGRRWWLLGALPVAAAAIWLGVRALQPPEPPELETALHQRVGRLAVPLSDGDEIAVGDHLFLELQCDRAAHVYVFDVDARGQVFTLFPLPGFELGNPLAPGVAHELPGRLAGEVRDWQVTSPGGGAEWIVVVAAGAPLQELEELALGAPPARPDAPLEHATLDERQRTALLRGVGGTAPAGSVGAAAEAGPGRGADLVDELTRLGSAPSSRATVRVHRLRSRS